MFSLDTFEVNKFPILLQVFFAQLILADMNKELKGLRFLALKLFKYFHWTLVFNSVLWETGKGYALAFVTYLSSFGVDANFRSVVFSILGRMYVCTSVNVFVCSVDCAISVMN